MLIGPNGGRFRLVVFDWDGTIVDSTGAIAESIMLASADLGYPLRDRGVASYVIGLGLRDALALAVPQLPESEYGVLADRYKHHFLARDAKVKAFSGVEAMLGRLMERGHCLGVATGKSSAGLSRSLEATGLRRFFRATRCADQSAPKPSPAMIFELMDEIGVGSEQTLMVGDTTHDIRMAQNAGIACVAVTYGAHRADDLALMRPLACIDSVMELDGWLQKNA